MTQHLPTLAALIGGLLLIFSGGGDVQPVPIPGDILGQCHVADRVSQIRILRDAATMPADDKRAIVQAINEARSTARTDDWVPFTDAVAVAIDSGTLSELADELEAAQ